MEVRLHIYGGRPAGHTVTQMSASVPAPYFHRPWQRRRPEFHPATRRARPLVAQVGGGGGHRLVLDRQLVSTRRQGSVREAAGHPGRGVWGQGLETGRLLLLCNGAIFGIYLSSIRNRVNGVYIFLSSIYHGSLLNRHARFCNV